MSSLWKKCAGILLLSSCSLGVPLEERAPPILSVAKQKQKVSILEKKLLTAERQKEKADRHCEELQEALQEAQLVLIRTQLARYQKEFDKKGKEEDLFAFEEERKALHHLVSHGALKHSREAQEILDRILEIITDRRQ